MCLKFHLDRKEDVSGVSGVSDNIAEGVIFDDGKVVIHWNTEHSSIAIYNSILDVEIIHGHGNKTKIVYDDVPKKEELNKDGN